MTRPLMLSLTLKTFEKLHKVAERKGKKASVDKIDLLALLMDHARALARLQAEGVETEENYADCNAVHQARD